MEKITLDNLLSFKFLGKLTASFDQKKVAFVVSKPMLEKNEYHHTLYLGNSDSITKLRQLKKNNDFKFLTNEKLLIALQKNKKEEKALKESFNQSFYLYDFNTKDLSLDFTLPFVGTLEAVLNEHTLLISASLKVSDHILYEGTLDQRKAYLKEKKKSALYEDIDQLPYQFNAQGFTTDIRKQLFLYDRNTNTVKRLFDKDFSFENYALSKDNKTIYYTGKLKEKVSTFTSKLYAYHILEDTHETLYDQLDYNFSKIIIMDEKIVVAARTMKNYGLNENPDFYLLKDNQLRLLAKHGEAFGNSMGSDVRLLGSEQSFVKDNDFYFVTTIDDHTELKKLSLDGNLETAFVMNGSIDGLALLKDSVFMIGLKEQALQEAYQLDLKHKKLTRLSRFNQTILNNKYVAKPETVTVNFNSHDVKGFVLKPINYDASKKYPAIFNIHGGPKTIYGQVFYHEMQYWASKGYFVFFANPRGSDGKGNEFADIRGKYGTIDYEDLMAFKHKVLKQYFSIDENQVFVTGGSYGGFMTNWIVGHTHEFKAAVTQRCISNWLSFYGTSDIGYFFAADQTDGHPLKDMDKLYEQSPIKYAQNMKTPLLFIHSDKDHRCPIEQAQQLYAILKTQSVDTKLIWIKDENHDLSRNGKPQARVKRLTEITEWFNKYRKN
ncbi:MAG: alpha/beta hydrolase family protein [Candidatus Izemoplasmataceae bacterium]